MAESPKTQVLRILESKWDTLVFANAPIKTENLILQYKSNGIVWWGVPLMSGMIALWDVSYDTHEDWPLWAEILEELKTLEA